MRARLCAVRAVIASTLLCCLIGCSHEPAAATTVAPAGCQSSAVMQVIRAHVPPAQAYAAITTTDGVRGWWTRDATLGATGQFWFFHHHAMIEIRVDEQTPTRVAWRVLAGPPGWAGTTIELDLQADDEGTLLMLAHRGFAATDLALASTTATWGNYMRSLQQYLETGTGTPSPDQEPFRARDARR